MFESIAGPLQIKHHIVHVLGDEMRQHETVMQFGAPADQAAGIRPLPKARHQGAQQQHLHQAHVCMGRHFEGTEFDQAKAAHWAVRRIQFVDAKFGAMGIAGNIHQQIPQQPVHQPGLDIFHAGPQPVGHLLECDLQFVQTLVARFVHPRRLAGRADKHARKQIGQSRMILPKGNQTHQHIGPPQHGRLFRRRAAQRDVIAAAGAGMAAVKHEFLGAEPGQARCFVNGRGVFHQFRPRTGRRDVDFDHARVGGDLKILQARIMRRWIAFDTHRHR